MKKVMDLTVNKMASVIGGKSCSCSNCTCKDSITKAAAPRAKHATNHI